MAGFVESCAVNLAVRFLAIQLSLSLPEASKRTESVLKPLETTILPSEARQPLLNFCLERGYLPSEL